MNETVFPVKTKPPLLFLIPLAAGVLMHFFFQKIEPFADGFTNHLIGWPLIAAGLLLGYWAKKTFSAHGVETRFKAVKNLVSTGPYSLSRNPLYITLVLLYLGISLVLNTLWPLILIPLPISFLYYRVILLEEDYLEMKFGEEYRNYKKKVRRWL